MARTLAVAGLALLTASCYGNADIGQLAPRLAPLWQGPSTLVASAAVRKAWQLADTDQDRAQEQVVGVQMHSVRRPARIITTTAKSPAQVQTRVPEGIRELRLWLSAALSTSPVDSSCTVHAKVSWDDAKEQLDLPAAPVAGNWQALRLLNSPKRQPTRLQVELIPTAACGATPLLVAHSEVMPIAARGLEKRPNVVLVVIDTLRRDHLDCGKVSQKLMPQLFARWCSRGVFFDNAWSTSSWTYPSIASMFTGLWPHAHGGRRAGGVEKHLLPHITTLAELLSREGYATFGVTGNPVASHGLSRGFDTYVELWGSEPGLFRENRRASHAVDAALAFLAESKREPFFISLVLMDMHEPVDAALKVGPPPPECAGVVPPPTRWQGLSQPSPSPSPTDEHRLACRRALYQGAARYVDRQLDRLIDYFVDSRLEGRTAFIVVSDHGEELWDHATEEYAERTGSERRWGVDHGHTLYQEITHVPLLLVPPARSNESPATLRSHALVSVADVFATALGVAGAPVPTDSPSRDLTWALTGMPGLGREHVVSETTLYGPQRWAVTTARLRAIDTEGGKLVVFDRQNDPEEKKPLPPAAPLYQRGAALVQALHPQQPANTSAESPERQALEALGYIK